MNINIILGSPAAELRRGDQDRDLLVMREFLGHTMESKALQLNGMTPQECYPGLVTLLDALLVDAEASRYRVPSQVYLENLTKNRCVSWKTLDKVN